MKDPENLASLVVSYYKYFVFSRQLFWILQYIVTISKTLISSVSCCVDGIFIFLHREALGRNLS